MINTKKKFVSFEDVPVWKLSHKATLNIYVLTRKFPRDELYCLTSQLRRSALSVAANVAEGFSKNTTKDLINYLYNSRGSCSETLYHLNLAKDLDYIDNKTYVSLQKEYNMIGK